MWSCFLCGAMMASRIFITRFLQLTAEDSNIVSLSFQKQMKLILFYTRNIHICIHPALHIYINIVERSHQTNVAV